MNENVEGFLRLLYPNYDEIQGEEKAKADEDKKFLERNIKEILEDYIKMHNPNSGAQKSKKSDNEILKIAIENVKTRNYLKLLHPKDLRWSSTGEIYNFFDDQYFISRHIEEIEEALKAQSGENISEKTALLSAIKIVKEAENRLCYDDEAR